MPTSLKILNLSDTGNCFDARDARQPQLRARQAMLWPSLAAGFAISTFAASLIFDSATRQYGATVAGTLAIGMYLFGCSNVAIDCCMPQSADLETDANAQAVDRAASPPETVTLREQTRPVRPSAQRQGVDEDSNDSAVAGRSPFVNARVHSRPQKSDDSTLVLASTCVAAGVGTLLGALIERSASMLIGTAAGGVGGAVLGVAYVAGWRIAGDACKGDSASDSDSSDLITLSNSDSEDSRDDIEAIELAVTDSRISGESSTLDDSESA